MGGESHQEVSGRLYKAGIRLEGGLTPVKLKSINRLCNRHESLCVIKMLTNSLNSTWRMHEAKRYGCIFGCRNCLDTQAHYVSCPILASVLERNYDIEVYSNIWSSQDFVLSELVSELASGVTWGCNKPPGATGYLTVPQGFTYQVAGP